MEKRAVIYIRVSDESQIKNHSLETQLEASKQFAKSRGFEVVKVFREEGKSAKHVYTRDELRNLIQFCATKSNRIDALIVYKFDRFSRNTEEGLAAISLLAKYHVQVMSVTENVEQNPMGTAMRSIMIALAQLDNEMKGERVKDNMVTAFTKGFWTFKCPIGYKRPFHSKEDNKGKPAVLDTNLAPIIRNMFANAGTGIYNKSQLAEIMNAEGFAEHYQCPATHKMIDFMLSNTFYFGQMYAPKWDKYAWGKHEPLVTREVWEQAHNAIFGKRKGEYKFQDEVNYPLKGHLVCSECGKPLTTSPSKGSHKVYYYYECRNIKCKKVRIDSSLAHKLFENKLQSIKPNARVLKLFEDIIFSEWDKVISERRQLLESYEGRIREKKDEMSSVRKSKDEGIYTVEEAKELVELIRKELTVLEIEKSDIAIDTYDAEAVSEFTHHFLLNFDNLWANLDLPKRQAMIEKIFPQGIEVTPNKDFRTTKLSPSFALIQTLDEQKEDLVTLSIPHPNDIIDNLLDLFNLFSPDMSRLGYAISL